MSRSGQTTMLAIALMVIVVVVLGVFLLSLAGNVSQSEYLNIYGHNLLLSAMRTDTGFTDSNCKLVSDALTCSFLTPTWKCGGSSLTCKQVAQDSLKTNLEQFDQIKNNFRYLLTAEPSGFIVRDSDGKPTVLEIGDTDLKTERVNKIVANEILQKNLGGQQLIIKVTLLLAEK